jgi:hypothetical protein
MSDQPITDLVRAILEVTAPITQMLDHMMCAPGEPSIDEVVTTMKRLLEDVLAPLESHDDVRAATAVLDAAMPLILEGIFFVPHPNRAERRSRRARRPA